MRKLATSEFCMQREMEHFLLMGKNRFESRYEGEIAAAFIRIRYFLVIFELIERLF